MEFSFIVNASVERDEGKFESRETIEGELIEALEGADPGSIAGENGGTYSVQEWAVEENVQEKPAKRAKGVPDPARGPSGLDRADLIAPNLVAIIEAWVKCNDEHDWPDDPSAELFKQLDILCGRFPRITEQAKAKLASTS